MACVGVRGCCCTEYVLVAEARGAAEQVFCCSRFRPWYRIFALLCMRRLGRVSRENGAWMLASGHTVVRATPRHGNVAGIEFCRNCMLTAGREPELAGQEPRRANPVANPPCPALPTVSSPSWPRAEADARFGSITAGSGARLADPRLASPATPAKPRCFLTVLS